MKTRTTAKFACKVLCSSIVAALICCAILLSGCDEGRNYPYETNLIDSHGNGGWVLFDAAPENYDKGHTIALEEQAKVRVTGPAVAGRTSDTKLFPVTVLSGKNAGRNGWVISTALEQQ
jgi:hypothetical protein